MDLESRRLISTFYVQHPVYKGDIGMIKREIIDIKFMYLETWVVENKKDRERRAYTHSQRRVRTKEIYNFVCNISKNRNYISRCLSHPAPVAYTFSLPHSHQQRDRKSVV